MSYRPNDMYRQVIRWKDFILDQTFGPLLDVEGEDQQQGRAQSAASRSDVTVMDDGEWSKSPSSTSDRVSNQKARQEQQPARMAGNSSLDSFHSDMEVSQHDWPAAKVRQMKGGPST